MANTVLQGSRDAVHWLVLKESNNAILGEGIISSVSFDYFQPSIAANRKGQFLMAFNRSGSTAPGGDISIYGAVGSGQRFHRDDGFPVPDSNKAT